jgi:hypothetical protein
MVPGLQSVIAPDGMGMQKAMQTARCSPNMGNRSKRDVGKAISSIVVLFST